MRTAKIISILLTLVILCVLLCGCGSDISISIIGGADGPTQIILNKNGDSDLTPVTLVLDWTPNVNHSGAYAALAKGYFAEQGLDVSIVQPGDNLALQLLSAGQADFGFSYQEEVTFARVAGLPVLSLAAVIQHNTSCFAAPQKNGITSVQDMGGKVYGGWGGAVEAELLDYLLEQAGVTDPVQTVNLGSADFFSAVDSGQVDFSWIFYAVTGVEAELRDQPLNLLWLRELEPCFDYYTPVVAANEQFVQQNKELTTAFMAALSKGYRYADEHPQETADILLAYAPELDAELVCRGAEWMAGRYQDDAPYWGWQDEQVWSGFADWLTERGLLDDGFVAGEAFCNDYLPQSE